MSESGKRRRSVAEEAAALAAAVAAATAAATAAAEAKAATALAAAAAAAEAKAEAALAAAAAAADAKAAAALAGAAAKNEEGFMCSVCAGLLFQPISTACGHTFCKVCLGRWLKKKGTCPLCNAATAGGKPLAVNKALEAAIESNAGPLCIVRMKSKRFYEQLVALEPAAALAELNDAVDVTLFVGDAAAETTPLLWVCERAKGDKWLDWVALAEKLIARPGADLNARDAKNQSTLSLVCGTGDYDVIGTLIPALMSKGVRDASALGRALFTRWTYCDLSEGSYSEMVIALTSLAEDASILTLSAADRCDVFDNVLKNGFDAVGVALFKKGFRSVAAYVALRFAAAGGCAEVIKLLCKAPAPLVPVDRVFEMGQTALHIACLHGRSAAALALIECGAAVSAIDNFFTTPLTLCVFIHPSTAAAALSGPAERVWPHAQPPPPPLLPPSLSLQRGALRCVAWHGGRRRGAQGQGRDDVGPR